LGAANFGRMVSEYSWYGELGMIDVSHGSTGVRCNWKEFCGVLDNILVGLAVQWKCLYNIYGTCTRKEKKKEMWWNNNGRIGAAKWKGDFLNLKQLTRL